MIKGRINYLLLLSWELIIIIIIIAIITIIIIAVITIIIMYQIAFHNTNKMNNNRTIWDFLFLLLALML